jgi:hypothetical protein
VRYEKSLQIVIFGRFQKIWYGPEMLGPARAIHRTWATLELRHSLLTGCNFGSGTAAFCDRAAQSPRLRGS